MEKSIERREESSVSHVIIRVGYRGSSQGALIDDPTFKTNMVGATAAGLKVGVYFTQAVDEVEAVQEASMVLTVSAVTRFPIRYSWMWKEAAEEVIRSILPLPERQYVRHSCNTIQNAGYTAGVYANKTWLSQKMDAKCTEGYKIWLAQYAAAPTYTDAADLWQYKPQEKSAASWQCGSEPQLLWDINISNDQPVRLLAGGNWL